MGVQGIESGAIEPAVSTHPDTGDATAPAARTHARVSGVVAAAAAMDASRYEFRSALGEGGMGEVRLYRDSRIGRDVAMKLIHPAHTHRAIVHARFVREGRIQGQLEHPAIVPVYDLGTHADGAAYFTMKCVNGRTLEEVVQHLRDGESETSWRYSRRKLLTAFCTACLAVHFAHTRGVLHRDLKPANVMLGEFGEVYVLDWGIAKPVDAIEGEPEPESSSKGPTLDGSHTVDGSVLGTPGYIAPEQLRGDGATVDGRADVYALGSILFELLALGRLHNASSTGEIFASTLEGTDARPSVRAPDREIPPELDDVCVRATALAPADRFATARDLHDAVERYLDGDRDLERRRALAEQHASIAFAASERALAGVGTDSLDERRRAMAEVGRALAFDPSHREAKQTLLRLLTAPPREIPPEAIERILASRIDEQRVVSRIGGLAYLAFLGFIPFVLKMGVRDWSAFATSAILFALTVAGCFAAAARPPGDRRRALAPLVLATIAIGSLATMLGPLVLVPGVVVMNTVGFILATRRESRVLTVAIALLAVVAPLALEWAGILPPSYAFRDGALIILPRMHGLPATTTMTFLIVAIVGHLIASAYFASRFRDALTDAELRAHLQAWQLRQMTDEVRHSSVPSPRRRG